MRERSGQATPQFRKEKTVREDQAQGTREFRKGKKKKSLLFQDSPIWQRK